jgi:hypothetical protein
MTSSVSPDSLYANIDDYKIANAMLVLRGSLEHELIRHAWFSQTALVPTVLFAGANVRAIAIGCDGCWGDLDACARALSPELFRELLRIVVDLPSRDFDWTMRALAVCLDTQVRAADATVESLVLAKAAREKTKKVRRAA